MSANADRNRWVEIRRLRGGWGAGVAPSEEERPPLRIVEQRLRNRLMELLDAIATEAADSPYDAINDWEFLGGSLDSRRPQELAAPVYTKEEIEAVGQVHQAWRRLERDIPADVNWLSFEPFESRSSWRALAAAAGDALTVFRERGRLSEEEEDS
jgi:hypothetical protein